MGEIAKGGEMVIFKQRLDRRIDIEKIIFGHLLHPPTAEEIAEHRAERERVWDAKTAEGLIGIVDSSDYECPEDWKEAKRGEYVHLWVVSSRWERYKLARDYFQATAAALSDEGGNDAT